jgi:hypothetical protein
LWTSLAYLTGSHITEVYDEIKRYEIYVLVALAVLVVALVVRHVLRRRHER